MELYIRLKDGQPFEHPIFGDNFRQAFPHVDTNNLPPEFAKFTRIEPPIVGAYEVYEGMTYGPCATGFTDVHNVRQMTAEEKTAKQDAVKTQWAQNGFASWTFNEDTCSFEPPIPRPIDEKRYSWDELTASWIEIQT